MKGKHRKKNRRRIGNHANSKKMFASSVPKPLPPVVYAGLRPQIIRLRIPAKLKRRLGFIVIGIPLLLGVIVSIISLNQKLSEKPTGTPPLTSTRTPPPLR